MTVTSTVPALPAGATAVIDESPFTAKGAGTPPKSTSLAAARFVPPIVTDVPPATGPVAGLTLVTVGAGRNVKRSAGLVALLTPYETTVTSTAPVLDGGESAVMEVSPLTENDVATAPKSTSVTLL